MAQWESALKLATMWEMKIIRQVVIAELNFVLTELEKLRLGRTYSVRRWVEEGLVGLTKSHRIPLSEGTHDEIGALANQVGWETIARVLRIQNRQLRERQRTDFTRMSMAMELAHVTPTIDLVRTEFEFELHQMDQD
jgi:hypothetical protein